MAKFGVPTEEQLAKINKLAKRQLSADEVFVFSGKSAGDMLIPNRYTRISKELLQVMVDDAKKGVSFMYGHNWGSFGIQGVPYGKVFDGRLEPSSEADETIGLYLDKFIVRDDEIIDGISANSLIKKIETGVLSDTSITFSTDMMKCSICGENYYSEKCHHYRGSKYEMGDGTQKVCTVTAMPPSLIIPNNNNALYEESIVWDGAYPGAVVSQAKNGDIIELPTGKFSIVDDKEEFSKDTLFLNKYHNGNILTMVKKSEPKKIHNLGGIDEGNKKGAKKLMNEKLQNMLESLGIECKEGKMPDDVLEQLSEKWEKAVENIQAAAEPLKPVEQFMAKEKVSEKLGAEISADEVLNLAKEGQDYHKHAIEEAINRGTCAYGNDFPVETYREMFKTLSVEGIKKITETFNKATESIPAGRHTDPEAGQKQSVSIPDDAFKVGK